MNDLWSKIRSVFWVTLTLLMLGMVLEACSPLRKYPEGSYLLKRNKIIVDNKDVNTEDVRNLLKQKPTRKNLGLYVNVRLWNFSVRGKDTGFKRWIKRTIAAEPVLFDSTLTENSVKQLYYYMHNHGYFGAKVNYAVKYKPPVTRSILHTKKGTTTYGRRKAVVTYTIQSAQPYTIRNVSYFIKDATLKAYVYSSKSDCRIKSGEKYNVDNIDAERDRINKNLQMNGYYAFSKDYITFLVDTALNTHQLDITIKLSNVLVPLADNPDSLITVKHKRYSINRIIINTDYNLDKSATVKYDTVRTIIPNRHKGRPPKIYYVVYPGKLKINLKTLAQAMYIDSNDVFNYVDVEKTYKALLDQRLYRYVNIEFVKVNDTMPASGLLNCLIKLSKAPVQAISVSTDATHSGGELGVAAAVTYANKNLFRGAELFSVKVKGAVEFQSFNKKTNIEKPVIQKLKFVNTIEAGVDLDIKIPRFLLPVNQTRFPKNFKPKTNINAVFNYQIRPQYERFYTSASFGYQWKESEFKTHFLTPLQINLVKIYPDSTFNAQIDLLNDRALQNSYRDHIITSLSYTFLYNTQQISKNTDFVYFKTNVEMAGLLFFIVSQIQKKPGAYKLFDIPYSQYFRVDADFRYYMFVKKSHLVVFRAYGGYGMPFDNENVLPFEKSFYQGGANSMRAWRLKTLGPGSYNGASTYALERIGEIGLEGNAEYRFPIYKFLRGAAFVDIGNVWMRKTSEQLPGAEFRFKKFLSDLAFDGGLGLRADFGYFVIRLDGAVVLKNPAQPIHSRWIGQNSDKFAVFGNFGIGYPF
ncbi:MAG: BamA/TamA family outer membrane protein [Bacteroidota bacterium]